MADIADRADPEIERGLEAAIAQHRGDIPAGEPGTCCECGDDFPRLVGGLCVPCRELAEERRQRRMGR